LLWLHVVEGRWEGLDVGALVLVVVMEAVVDIVILDTVEEMVEGVVGEFLIPLPADQNEVEAVDMTMSRRPGTLANFNYPYL
jgi:hypothetical protein